MQNISRCISWLLLVSSVCTILIVTPCAARTRSSSRYLDGDPFDEFYNRSISKASLESKKHRIAGGYDIQHGEHPSFIGLLGIGRYGMMTLCSGVAISDRLVLTAAHCFQDDLIIRAAPSIWTPSLWKHKRVETFDVVKRCISANYKPIENGYPPAHDYQVMRLDRPMDGIEFALLPTSHIRLGDRAIAVGLGIVSNAGGSPIYASRAQALPVERAMCENRFRHPTRICFESYEPDHIGDTCQGDSGGPIYSSTPDGKPVVVALTSFGKGLCESGTNGLSGNADLYNGYDEVIELVRECLN